MTPKEPTPEYLCELARRCESLERGRRVGILCLYSPAFALAMSFAGLGTSGGNVGPGAGPLPVVSVVFFAFTAVAMLLSVPLIPIGIIVRSVASLRLKRLCAESTDSMVYPWPLVRRGERLGDLVITHASPGAIRLARRPAPPILWIPMKWAMESVVSLMVVLTAYAIISTPAASAPLIVPGLLLICLWIGMVEYYFVDVSWSIETIQNRWQITRMRSWFWVIRRRAVFERGFGREALDSPASLHALERVIGASRMSLDPEGQIGHSYWQRRRLLNTLLLSAALDIEYTIAAPLMPGAEPLDDDPDSYEALR